MGPSQNPRVQGLLGLAPVQPCDNGLIVPVEDFLARFPYPARRGVIARSVTTKQSHRWDRPAQNAGLPFIRRPELRSRVQSVPILAGPRTREWRRAGRPCQRRLLGAYARAKTDQPRQPPKCDLMANSH